MRLWKNVVQGCLFSLVALTANMASAGLIGDTISGSYEFPTSTSVYGGFSYSVNPFVVGAGVESTLTVDGFPISVDFSDNQLVLGLPGVGWTSAAFNGPEFTVVSGNPFDAISSVVTSGGQTVSATLVGGVLEVNWQGQSFNPGDTVTVNFGGTVPEPSSFALAGLGAIGLAIGAYRRRKASV